MYSEVLPVRTIVSAMLISHDTLIQCFLSQQNRISQFISHGNDQANSSAVLGSLHAPVAAAFSTFSVFYCAVLGGLPAPLSVAFSIFSVALT